MSTHGRAAQLPNAPVETDRPRGRLLAKEPSNLTPPSPQVKPCVRMGVRVRESPVFCSVMRIRRVVRFDSTSTP